MPKARDAFRTISEVAEWLDTPAHVLRFWESKFTQVKPVKRAGGRRYYRPDDMALLGGIKTLLHEDGMTIKGVQKLLREKGVRHVASLGPVPEGAEDPAIEGDKAETAPAPEPVVSFSARPAPEKEPGTPAPADTPAPEPDTPQPDTPEPALTAQAGDTGGPGFGMQMSFGGFGGEAPNTPSDPEADTAPDPEADPAPDPEPEAQAPAPAAASTGPDLPPDIDEDSIDPPPGPAGRLAALDRAALAERAVRLAPLAARLGTLAERLPRP